MALTLTHRDLPRTFTSGTQAGVWEQLFQAASQSRRQDDAPALQMARYLAQFGYVYDAALGAVKASPEAAKAPSKVKAAPKAEPQPKPEQPAAECPVAAARAKYGRLFPEAFHKRTGRLNKGWCLVRGIPTWEAALMDRA